MTIGVTLNTSHPIKNEKVNEKVDQKAHLEIEFEGPDALDPQSNVHSMNTDTIIRIAKDQYSVFELLRKEAQQRIILSPDFQRHDVWNSSARAELVESVLLGIPIPLIYLFEDEHGIRQVVDGKQRISALKDFINNDLKLVNLKMLTELNGKRFADIEAFLQAKIEDYQLNTYVIQPPTPEHVKFNIFDRVNRGGTRLNKQEMRHALYYGKATALLTRLTQSHHFRNATGGGVKSERMRDQYLVLRFIGFYLYRTDQLDGYQYQSDIDDFLAYVMKFINANASDKLIEELAGVCEWGLYNTYMLLGPEAFRFQPKGGGHRRPVNMGLFEMLVFAFNGHDYAKINKDRIQQEIESRKADIDDQGLFSGILDSTSYVNMRFYMADEIRIGLEDA
ncbi:MAG: hypothetical protein ACI8WB_005670 [Phenylobacterium sp.]|jgi:hypothetical protein